MNDLAEKLGNVSNQEKFNRVKSTLKNSSSTTFIKLENDITNGIKRSIDKDNFELSFLLSIFDNIVGPKIVHYWTTVNNEKTNDQLLKYIAIHTLNGELYQDKLYNQHKYRFYLIKEIDCAIFSVFFDASTISSGGSGREVESIEPSDDESVFNPSSPSSYSIKKSNNKSKKPNPTKVETTLNCFSMITPLNNKNLIFDHYGDNTRLYLNYFENIIQEYKVLAQISPKVLVVNLLF